MPRIYKVPIEDVAVAAAQDVFQIKGATGKMLRILRVHLGATDTTAPTNQQLKYRARLLPVTVTDGSGGSTPTPAKTDDGDAAATFTALANSTTKATTNGTPVNKGEWGVNVFSGFDEEFGRPISVLPSQSYVFELLSTPSGTLHLSGFVEVEENG